MYYQFVNTTRNINDYTCKRNIKINGILSLIDVIINENDWNSNDVIMGFPIIKNNPVLRYQDGDFQLKL